MALSYVVTPFSSSRNHFVAFKKGDVSSTNVTIKIEIFSNSLWCVLLNAAFRTGEKQLEKVLR